MDQPKKDEVKNSEAPQRELTRDELIVKVAELQAGREKLHQRIEAQEREHEQMTRRMLGQADVIDQQNQHLDLAEREIEALDKRIGMLLGDRDALVSTISSITRVHDLDTGRAVPQKLPSGRVFRRPA